MQPSSLIFLVIVAIWAAYLIQHWVRRREHLATARSVDKFSEAMRVLERRSPLPVSDLSTPRPDSYAVRPPSARPEVVVKKAGVSRPQRSRTQVALRKIRGLAFLVTLAAVPVMVALSAMHILKWVSVAIAGAAFVAVVAWLRISAKREQAARRAARQRPSATESVAPVTASRRRAARPMSGDELSRVVGALQEEPVAARRSAARAEVVFDEQADASAVVEAPAAATATAAVPDGGWSPVPVPPPTYTLKDTAARHTPEPADVSERPVPIEVEDNDVELLHVVHTRRIG